MKKRQFFPLSVVLITLLTIAACSTKTYNFRSNYKEANQFIHESNNLKTKLYLKAHLKNGDVCIFKDSWYVDTLANIVSGEGHNFDFNRKRISEGYRAIPIDSVAIFETNSKLENPEENRIRALAIMAGIDVFVGVLCLANPKACFGSCPTFYINEEDDFHYADAEGYSSAIAPSMAYSDIDALNNPPLTGNSFSLTMKNEALETHCTQDIKLLAYPRESGQRIYQSPNNDFYRCRQNYPLTQAMANEGDVTTLLKHEDRNERFSLADENNLRSKEEIILNFEDIQDTDNLGLILNFRQTLMTTYFIYSAMGYMGDQVGDMFAKIETSSQTKAKLKGGIQKELGNIDIYAWNEAKQIWEYQHGFYETGPIAINRQFIPLSDLAKDSTLKLKIVMNKGLWRIDYVALTNIIDKVEPLEIRPDNIVNKGKPNLQALNDLINPDKLLISMPGSHYTLHFTLPDSGTDYELFLYSKGYYLEWMREQWIKDKDLLKLRQMIENPIKYLREEARHYKAYEENMEEVFWNSKVDTKTITHHEN
jgi:hypothetical protein